MERLFKIKLTVLSLLEMSFQLQSVSVKNQLLIFMPRHKHNEPKQMIENAREREKNFHMRPIWLKSHDNSDFIVLTNSMASNRKITK